MGDLTMTRKLYDLDSHRRDFSATVLRCDPDGARYAVVLDQTVFFPEGGGQPADTGVLGGARVLDVQLLPDAIVHYTDAPLAPVRRCAPDRLAAALPAHAGPLGRAHYLRADP